jgi:hypothetical protein
MELDQLLGHRQSNPKSSLSPRTRAIELHKPLEDLRQQAGRDADAVIGDPHYDIKSLPLDSDIDVTTTVAVLAGIVEQVLEHLGQPHRVRVEKHGLGQRGDRQGLSTALEGRPAWLSGLHEDQAKADSRLPNLEPILRNPGDVQQVVNHPLHPEHLPFHRRERWLDQARVAMGQPQDCKRVHDRAERVSELVRHGGQDFVRSAVTFGAPPEGLFPVGRALLRLGQPLIGERKRGGQS